MGDIIVALVILIIIVLAIRYIVVAKKKGVKCIGCNACSGKPTDKKKEHSGCSCSSKK